MKKMVCELCGSNDFTKDSDGLFVCDYCRTKYTPAQAQNMLVEGTVRVDRSDEVGKFLKIADAALSHDNPAEAYEYANRALEIDPTNSQAWFTKGKAAGWSSSLMMPRHKEMIGAFKMAIDNAPEEEREEIQLDAAVELNEVATAVHRASRLQAYDNASIEEYWSEHINRTDDAITMYFMSHTWSGNRQPLDNVVSVASGLFNGPTYEVLDFESRPSATELILATQSSKAGKVTRSLTSEGQAYFRGKIEEASVKIKEIDPSYETPTVSAPQQKSGPCFVITATMGHADSYPVRLLQEYRDDVLTKTRSGRRFIQWYYENGPRMATIVATSPLMRLASFLTVVLPSTFMASIHMAIRNATHRH